MQQSKSGGIFTSEYTKTYNGYVEYLLNGENAEKTATLTTVKENNELVYPFNFNTVKKITYKGKTNINSYFENLNTKLNTLKEKAGSNKKDSVEKNVAAVEVLEKTINYPKYFNELKAEYKKSENAAKAYVQNNFNYSGDNENLKNISVLQRTFYESLISEYIIYAGVDCINSDGYDYNCAVQKYGLDGATIILDFEQQVSTAYKKLTDDSTLRILNKAVIDLTAEMSEN
ncbi:MAG: hypothetical protein Q4E70_00010 [Candidatus Saccharibacteria bacterium]|nr:hypothetical protein [Candidatus Saccharibacteria bacterium]